MAKSKRVLARPASPTIDEVFDAFLDEQEKRLKPRTFSKYEDVIELLHHYINDYGHDSLSKAEEALLEKRSEGDESPGICGLFGPDKIVEHFSMFLSYYMVRKVWAGEELKRYAGTVTKKLAKWLAAKGYVSAEEAEDGAAEGASASKDLPRAERAARMLAGIAADAPVSADELKDKDYLDFDHFSITKLRQGKIWLAGMLTPASAGPIAVPSEVTNLLEEGWDVSCSLVRYRGKWYFLDVANVYPN